jgi:hypothetical protein
MASIEGSFGGGVIIESFSVPREENREESVVVWVFGILERRVGGRDDDED